jgi:hypothetical protein
VIFYVGSHGRDVAELEGCYFRATVPEEGLAVSTVLKARVSIRNRTIILPMGNMRPHSWNLAVEYSALVSALNLPVL